MKLNDMKLSRFTLLQTGSSGHGKTTRALTATRFGKVFVFDFDGKIQGAARSTPSNLGLPPDWQGLVDVEVFTTFAAALAKAKELAAKPNDYGTIVIDTFTNLNELLYVEIMGAKLEQGKKAEFEEWGKIGNLLVVFFNILFSTSANIIVNAHVSETEDEVTKKVKYGQAGRGGFRAQLPNRFTDSHYLIYQNDKNLVRVKNSDTLPVNTNIDPKFIDKFGYATVFDLSIFDDYAYRGGK